MPWLLSGFVGRQWFMGKEMGKPIFQPQPFLRGSTNIMILFTAYFCLKNNLVDSPNSLKKGGTYLFFYMKEKEIVGGFCDNS